MSYIIKSVLRQLYDFADIQHLKILCDLLSNFTFYSVPLLFFNGTGLIPVLQIRTVLGGIRTQVCGDCETCVP